MTKLRNITPRCRSNNENMRQFSSKVFRHIQQGCCNVSLLRNFIKALKRIERHHLTYTRNYNHINDSYFPAHCRMDLAADIIFFSAGWHMYKDKIPQVIKNIKKYINGGFVE